MTQFSRSLRSGSRAAGRETIAGIERSCTGGSARPICATHSVALRCSGRANWAGNRSRANHKRRGLLRIEIVPLVATRGEDAELQSQASALAHEWLQDRHALDPDMVAPVLSTAAWNGDRAFFDLLVDEIKKTKVQRERLWMISAHARLSRSGDHAFGARSDLRQRHRSARAASVLLQGAPQETREAVWQFVQQNFDRLNSTLPGARGIPFGATLPLTASGFCDAQHRSKCRTFFRTRIAQLAGRRAQPGKYAGAHSPLHAPARPLLQPAVSNFLKSYHQEQGMAIQTLFGSGPTEPNLLDRLKAGIQKTRSGLGGPARGRAVGQERDRCRASRGTRIHADHGRSGRAHGRRYSGAHPAARRSQHDGRCRGDPQPDSRTTCWKCCALRRRPIRVVTTPPAVVMVVGVNGAGKTTTIGKLAHRFLGRRAQGSAVRRGYVSRGGYRATRSLGAARGCGHDPAEDRRGPERGGFRCAASRQGARRRLRDRGYGGPPAYERKPDGGTRKDAPHVPARGSRLAARGLAGAGCDHRPERTGAGAQVHRIRRA